MKKLTSLLLALVMLFTALTLSGCVEKNTGLYGCYDDQMDLCAHMKAI